MFLVCNLKLESQLPPCELTPVMLCDYLQHFMSFTSVIILHAVLLHEELLFLLIAINRRHRGKSDGFDWLHVGNNLLSKLSKRFESFGPEMLCIVRLLYVLLIPCSRQLR